jgi:nitrous oxide reductase accessory protein NosL
MRRNPTMKKSFLVLASVAVMALVGCKSDGDKHTDTKAASTGSAVNTYCVMNPTESANPEVTTTYNGEKYAFCCASCKGKFEAKSAEEKATLAAAAKAKK